MLLLHFLSNATPPCYSSNEKLLCPLQWIEKELLEFVRIFFNARVPSGFIEFWRTFPASRFSSVACSSDVDCSIGLLVVVFSLFDIQCLLKTENEVCRSCWCNFVVMEQIGWSRLKTVTRKLMGWVVEWPDCFGDLPNRPLLIPLSRLLHSNASPRREGPPWHSIKEVSVFFTRSSLTRCSSAFGTRQQLN